jgi:hypothetical protein
MLLGGASDDITVGVADADGDGPQDPAADRRRWLAIAGATIGVVGFSACLTTLYMGARSVEGQGGFCASGGPYAIAHQCTSGETRQVLIGILGMLVFGAVFVGLTAFADGPVLVPSGLLWAALFGSLGVGFLLPPKGSQSSASNAAVGGLFLLMAAGGVWPAITSGLAWIRRGGEPEADDPAFGGRIPLVKASVQPPPAVDPEPSPASGGASAPLAPKRLVLPRKETP